MASDVINRKVSYLLRLLDQDHDGFLDESDSVTWVGRMAAIRGWEPGTEGYAGLEALFLDAFRGLHAAFSVDGRLDIEDARGAIVSMSESGAPEFDSWADGYFRLIDADGDGIIGLQEYRDLMLSVLVDTSAADESFARLDLNGDGYISRDEFTQLYLEFFTSDDPEAPGSQFWGPVR